jgi:hypothetical protein
VFAYACAIMPACERERGGLKVMLAKMFFWKGKNKWV